MWFNTALVALAALQGPEAAQGVTARPPPDQAINTAVRTEPQAPVSGVVSLERIRRELARSRSPRLLTEPTSRTPAFRVYVQATPFRMTVVEETFRQDWRPIQPGSIYHNELLGRVTRPDAMPYARLSGGGLASFAASSLMAYLGVEAVKETVQLIRKGVRAHQIAETRREIKDTISAIERNKLAAMNQTPPVGKQP
jgi:hypothetical protein